MWIEKREPESRQERGSEVTSRFVIEHHGRGVASGSETKHAVSGDKRRRTQGHGAFNPCRLLKGGSHAGHACEDEQPIADGTGEAYRKNMGFLQALSQDKDVLRADRKNEAKAEAKSSQPRREETQQDTSSIGF